MSRLGMLSGLKNDNEQAVVLEPYSDFAVVEVNVPFDYLC